MSAYGKLAEYATTVIGKTRQVAQTGRAVYRSVKGSKAAQAAAGAVTAAGAGAGIGALISADGTEYRIRRRSRGISAKEFRTTQRTMKKIIKMYNKLPKRSAKSSSCAPVGRGKTC